MRIRFFLTLLFLALLIKTDARDSYLIGRDLSWYPLRFNSLNPQVNIFTDSLLSEIAENQEIQFQTVTIDWIQLLENLDDEKIAGALTALTPNLISQKLYTFSQPFLLTGPVLVVPENSSITSLSQLREKIIGISQFDDSVLIVQQYPSLIIKTYEVMPTALQDLENGNIDALLFDTLQAHSLIPSRYPKLKIVSPPLNEHGLRLITLRGKNSELIDDFNQGLENLKKPGTYQKLREKFSLQ